MPERKGFTLIEIVVTIIIAAAIAAFAIPNYVTTMVQGEAKAAANNLINIYNAERGYYLTYGQYCINTTPSFPCDTLTDINNNLPLYTGAGTSAPLNIVDKYFTNYTCVVGGVGANGFQCKASSPNFAGFSLSVTNNPIILIGGTGCTTYAGGNCNPTCLPTNSIYCPSS